MSAYAQLSFDLMRLMNEADNPSTLFPAVLKLFCERLGWEFGALWRADYERLVVRCAAVYETDGGGDKHLFGELTKAREFHSGIGLPGTIWAVRHPVWVEDLASSGNFPRLEFALKEGFASGMGSPVAIGKRVFGVLEFFSKTKRQEDREQMDLLQVAAGQLARFLERIQAEEALTSSQSQFEVVAGKAIDPIVTIGEDSVIVFANKAMETLFGYSHDELVGATLTMLIPERMRKMHEQGMRRYLESGVRRLDWDGIVLPALHRQGGEITVRIRFGEFRRGDKRLFTGYISPVQNPQH